MSPRALTNRVFAGWECITKNYLVHIILLEPLQNSAVCLKCHGHASSKRVLFILSFIFLKIPNAWLSHFFLWENRNTWDASHQTRFILNRLRFLQCVVSCKSKLCGYGNSESTSGREALPQSVTTLFLISSCSIKAPENMLTYACPEGGHRLKLLNSPPPPLYSV